MTKQALTGLYSYDTPLLWEDGIYLIRVTDPEFAREPIRLYAAEYCNGMWYPTGVEYDPFQSDWRKGNGFTIEVICRLDLEAIAAGARREE